MEISTVLRAVLLCLKFAFSVAYSDILDDDIDVFDSAKDLEFKNSLSQELSNLKELEVALGEIIASNDRLKETLNASLPVSIKMLSDVDIIDPLEMNITSVDEFKKDVRGLFRTIAPITENQIGSGDDSNDDVRFSDLFTENPVDVNRWIESNTIDRIKREDDFNNKNESSDTVIDIIPSKVKFVDTTVASDIMRKTTKPMENEGNKIIKFMREEGNSESDLEEIFDEEETVPPKDSSEPSFIESSLKGLPSQYILRVLNAQNKAAKAMNNTYQSLEGGVVELLKSVG